MHFISPTPKTSGSIREKCSIKSSGKQWEAGSKRDRVPSEWTGSISPAVSGVKNSGYTINYDKLPGSYSGRCDKNWTEHQHLGGGSAFFPPSFVAKGRKLIVKSTMKS